jgi:hypothetical protein
MKNLITIIAFATAMLFGPANTVAQSLSLNSDRPEVIAKTKTASLNQKLELSGEQQRSVFRALVAKEVNYRKKINGKDITDVKVIAEQKNFDDAYTASMRETLTAAQFKQWKEMPNKEYKSKIKAHPLL